MNLNEEIGKILETTYSGSNHIGKVYDAEATSALLHLFEKMVEEAKPKLEDTLYEGMLCEEERKYAIREFESNLLALFKGGEV